MNKKSAFTLAEVLITLGIIGVISVLTMPTLVNNYSKKVYATSAQKFYNQMTTALSNYKSDYRVDSVRKAYNSQANAEVFLTKYFNVTKNCGETILGESECLAPEYKTLSGDNVVNMLETVSFTTQETDMAQANLDGPNTWIRACDCSKYPDYDNCSVREIQNVGPNRAPRVSPEAYIDPSIELELYKTCEYTYTVDRKYTCATINTGMSVCINNSGHVVFDVNGTKEPNTKGRDLFSFNIISDGSVADGEETECDDATSMSGCFTKLMNSNWTMDY